mgnify:CR=1 FL=1
MSENAARKIAGIIREFIHAEEPPDFEVMADWVDELEAFADQLEAPTPEREGE